MNEAARIASELTLKALSSLQERINLGEPIKDDDLLLLLSADTRGMIAEAQNRAHGTPRQSVTHGNDPDNPMPQTVLIKAADVNGDN